MSPLEAVIDDQIFRLQRRGGISRCFVELVREFGADPGLGVNARLPATWTVNEHLAELLGRRVRLLPLHSREVRLRRRFQRPPKARADVVHHTFYDARYLGPRLRGARVTTVCDMIPELYPEHFRRAGAHAEKLRFVRECDAVICISETTREDLLAVYGRVDTPIHVVPLGVSRDFARRPGAPRPVAEPYFLYVGLRRGYKDFPTLLRAFERAADALGATRLLCIGGGEFTEAERKAIAGGAAAGRVSRLEVPDAALADVYAGAEALVVTSRHEGYCLPLVEARAVGCPVIAADSRVVREVLGDQATVFPFGDAKRLAELLRAPEARVRTAPAAPRTWGDVAAATAAVYRTVLK